MGKPPARHYETGMEDRLTERRIVIDPEYCKGCAYCAATCPKKALSLSGHVNSSGYVTVVAEESLCSGCGLCRIVCPDYAISVAEDGA
jgi:2-oxoglutarate ferredoxin oxidoreductase subunit delta